MMRGDLPPNVYWLPQCAFDAIPMSPALYWEAGVEHRATSPEEMILAYVQAHGRITRREAVAVTGLGEEPSRYLLRGLAERGDLELVGAGRGAHYRARKKKNGD